MSEIADQPDRMVTREELRAILGRSNETIRVYLKTKRLPDPDIHVTRQLLAWKASTLRAAGFAVPERPLPVNADASTLQPQ